MPPKGAKKGSAKKSSTDGGAVNKNWETGLIKAEFEEESWQACVSFVVGSGPQEEELIQALSLAVQEPQRKLFTLLTWDDTLAKIHELGNPKAKKPDDAPMFYQVTEPAKLLLDAGEGIPCDLMAKILKFQLLLIKACDQQRSDANQAEGEKTAFSDKKGKGPHTPVIPPKEKKTKLKRRGDIEPPTFKDDEPEWGPQHYILMLGFYQPQLIAGLGAIGVHVSNVIKLCLEFSQNMEKQQDHQDSCEGNEQSLRASPVFDAAVQERKLNEFWSGLRSVLDSGPPDSRLHDVVQLSYTVPDFLLPFDSQDPETVLELGSQIFDGVASLIYDCLDVRRQYQQYRNSVKLISVPAVVKHSEPVEVVSAAPTPLSKKKSGQEEAPGDQESRLLPLSLDVDMCYYNNLLDLVPPEACSVPLILHCMLEQVVISVEQSLSAHPHVAEDSKLLSGPWLDHQLVSYMLQSFLPLVQKEEEKLYVLNNLLNTVQNEEDKKRLVAKFGARETDKKTEQPLVIRHHDERAQRFRDISVVQDFDPTEVELSMMRLSPVWEMIESATQQKNRKSCWMSIKQQLQHYCTDDDVSWPEVERFFHQSVFEAMPLSGVDQQGVLRGRADPAQQQTSTVIPWDDPLSFAKQQLYNMRNKDPTFLTEEPSNREEQSGRVCSHLDLSDIQSCRLRSLFHWHYAEHHNATVLPQLLQLASEEYRCLDTFRGNHNNILYVFCHNPMSPQRQSREFWHVALHTDVKFRSYFEHVADTVSHWTRQEESKRDTTQDGNDTPKSDSPKENTVCSSKEDERMEVFIRKGSLKAWKLEQERQKEEAIPKKSKKEDLPKDKQQKKEDKSLDNKKKKTSSDGKKSRPGTEGSSANPPTESAITTAPPVDEVVEVQQAEEPFNGFIGYIMDGKLIHVSGCLQYLFPSDGGRVTVETVSFVQGSSQMKVVVKKDGHHFYTHINQFVVDPAKCPPHNQDNKNIEPEKDCRVVEPVEIKTVKQGSFSAVLDNRIRLSYSFYGPTGERTVISQEIKGKVPETSIPDPIHLSASIHCSKEKDVASVPAKTQSTSSQFRPPEPQGCEGQPAEQSNLFNGLSLSIPNGLMLQYLREDTQEGGIMVRQSFPLHGRGKERHLQDTSLSKESSHTISSQGAVIRYMRDGSTEVLFADGSVSFSQDSGPVWVPDSEVQEQNFDQESEDSKKEEGSKEGTKDHRGCWLTTTPCGDRICTVGTTHKHMPTTSLLTYKATDPITHQVMLNREDLVVSVQNPDGSVIVEHADGTRISSLLQERPMNANRHCLLRTGDRQAHRQQPGSVTPKSASQCASDCTECVESIAGDMDVKDTCLNGDISRSSAGNACDREGAVHVCTNLNQCGCMCDESTESSVHTNSEQGVFAEDTATQNVETKGCEKDESRMPAKERMVLVEKEGCATVVMYPERQTAHIFLADGTVVTGNNQGEYEVFPSSVGVLSIRSDGTCVYSSDPLVTPSPKESTPTDQTGIYTMSHTDKVACEITDPDGNHFQVMEDGQISVLNLSPAPSMLKQTEEELEKEEDSEMDGPHEKPREQCPRLFLVHEDGSGTELLSSQTVKELLYQAYLDPTIALLKEQLANTQDEFGITILKPSHQSVWSQWLLNKQNPEITPPNLRNRSWHDFPAVEKKSPGPPFGTDVVYDLGLRMRPAGSAVHHRPVRSCPKVLELRELYQHRPLTTPLKNTIDSRLKEYIESLMEREQRSEKMKVKDPRSEEETAHASDLINLILSFPEEDDVSHTIDRRISEDVASLYSQGICVPAEQSDVSQDVATAQSDSLEKLNSCTKEKNSKWTEKLAQYRQEMCEEKIYREALRKRSVVPFFHPENIPLYESLLQQQIPDMRSLSMALPPFPKSDSTEGFLKDAPQEETPRPLNPTPSQSASHSARSSRVLEKRPTNPTPQSAGESSWRDSSRKCKSPQLDVSGKPRQTTVTLPSSVLGSKSCSAPLLQAEEPVRRKCQTGSLSNTSAIVKGFQLIPSSVDFGTLKEGTSSTITVVMKNVGFDICRFHVKQPPPATGLRVIYSPGPVAAGLQVELQVQLFAMCAVQAGEVEPKKLISQEIIIPTEKDILFLPVTATILPEGLYEIWLKDHSRVHKKNISKVFQASSWAGNRPDQSRSKRRTY
ncbi:sperm-associated antigen 17 isoform X2 [Oreochromis aureus]|uniref:sperm-associated antigen 17 isoform X2 n=1 Tax=Oreochromis aureus TaxID=47969 RepID=UPI0019536213|nr:sperm-associated antigen 17 isoform X2 [Oreochromis aureus]